MIFACCSDLFSLHSALYMIIILFVSIQFGLLSFIICSHNTHGLWDPILYEQTPLVFGTSCCMQKHPQSLGPNAVCNNHPWSSKFTAAHTNTGLSLLVAHLYHFRIHNHTSPMVIFILVIYSPFLSDLSSPGLGTHFAALVYSNWS